MRKESKEYEEYKKVCNNTIEEAKMEAMISKRESTELMKRMAFICGLVENFKHFTFSKLQKPFFVLDLQGKHIDIYH